jgi:ATP synthase protein I
MSDRGSGGRGPSGPGGEHGNGGPQDDRALADRLQRLGRSLDRPGAKDDPAPSSASTASSGWGQAVRVSSEFIAGVIVGGGIGWIVDWFFGISPIGLVIFLLLGFAAGVLNVLRVAGRATTPGRDPTKR